MGQTYYVCRGCGEAYSDHSRHATGCQTDLGGCGAGFCSSDCAELRNWDVVPFPSWDEQREMSDDEESALLCSCVVCRKESPEPADLVKFLLKRLGMSESDLRTAYTEEAQAERAKYIAEQRAELWSELVQYLPEKVR